MIFDLCVQLRATALHDILQALAELYHIQSPLRPKDDSLSSSATTDLTDKEQRAVTPRGQLAAQPTAALATSSELQSSFISRQELGMCSSADTPMTDGAAVGTAVAATADESGLQNTPASTSGVATDQSGQPPSTSRSHQVTSTASKPLCSQERQVHHVSMNQSPLNTVCIDAVVALAQHCFVASVPNIGVHLQVILPAMRMFLKPSSQRAVDGTVVELTRLEKLYRIFERC